MPDIIERIVKAGQFFAALKAIFGFFITGAALAGTLAAGASYIGLATQRDIDELRRAIQLLSRPADILFYHGTPITANGFCYVGEPCTFLMTAQRTPGAEDCDVIKNSTEYTILSFADFTRWRGQVTGGQYNENLTLEPERREHIVQIPASLPPGKARVEIIKHYENCPWQVDGEPAVVQISPSFEVEFRKRFSR